ncbi:MAG TPA: FHIPEP family type III secretion protein [bacterium]|nr:FHIPEP family type III secretion protein [bacterium]
MLDELKAQQIPNMTILRVLRALLAEKVFIRNLVTIFETMCEHGLEKEPVKLTEAVRAALAPQICEQFGGDKGTLEVLTLAPRIEEVIAKSSRGATAELNPQLIARFLDSLRKMLEDVIGGGGQPILLVSPRIRVQVRGLTQRLAPGMTILSYNEIVPTVAVKTLGMVDAEVA